MIKPSHALLRASIVLLLALGLTLTGAFVANAWNVSDGQTSISGVRVNGTARSDVTVPPGSAVQVKLDFSTVEPACLACSKQIEVGWAHMTNPDRCVFNKFVEPGVVYSGTKRFTLTAPVTPGSYFLAYDTAAQLRCKPAQRAWWVNPLDPEENFFAHITVE